MKKLLNAISFLCVVATFSFISCNLSSAPSNVNTEEGIKSGDIIFQINPKGQGKAIQLATGSKFTHCGVIFIEGGDTMVYHAVNPVKKSKFKDFITMGVESEYWIKRLNRNLSDLEIKNMKKYAISQLGKRYDIKFRWSDNEMYCSEYVWKIYHNGAGVDVGSPKQMKEYALSNPIVQSIMKKRYGKNIPMDEKMIAPGDIYDFSELVPLN